MLIFALLITSYIERGNYLYRVTLIVQSAGIVSIAASQSGGGEGDASSGVKDKRGGGDGGGGGGDGGRVGGGNSGGATPPPVVAAVDVAELGGPSQEVGIDPAGKLFCAVSVKVESAVCCNVAMLHVTVPCCMKCFLHTCRHPSLDSKA